MRRRQEPCVLLISPGAIKAADRHFGVPHLVSIGGYLVEHAGARVEILDLDKESGEPRDLERTLDELSPILVAGISCYSSFDYMRVLSLARFLRDRYPEVPVVAGGYHASAVPGDFVFDGSPFDVVVRGEGERPMLEVVETLLSGASLEKGILSRPFVEEMDELPPYHWGLLDRYWRRAEHHRGHLHIYLSRGCPHQCTFCMERSKGEGRWRAFSPERAVEELERLDSFTDLGKRLVNVADPLFGWKRSWRREVLRGIIEKGLVARRFWALTRSDDLREEDVDLLARASFSIGVGLESGSQRMLSLMRKSADPRRYLEDIERLARLAGEHGLFWAANLIVGHPGETKESMLETGDYVKSLFSLSEAATGWLSVDPFRLYPGSHVHENLEEYEQRHGATFHSRRWWRSWHGGSFKAEHIDPSRALSFEDRVALMYEIFAPLVSDIGDRFLSGGTASAGDFAASIEDQRRQMGEQVESSLLRRSARSRRGSSDDSRNARPSTLPQRPIGFHVRDPRVSRREGAVRWLLDLGVLRSESIVEALLAIAPESFMPEEEAEALLSGASQQTPLEGAAPRWLALRLYAVALEALSLQQGQRAADLLAHRAYLCALFRELVGRSGDVVAVCPSGVLGLPSLWLSARSLDLRLRPGRAATLAGLPSGLDAVFLGAALPKTPSGIVQHLSPGGRFATFVGPRFAPQDLVCARRLGDRLDERAVTRTRVPVLAGPLGWLRRPFTPSSPKP